MAGIQRLFPSPPSRLKGRGGEVRGCHLPEGVVSAGALLEANLEQDADQCPPVPDITNKPAHGSAAPFPNSF